MSNIVYIITFIIAIMVSFFSGVIYSSDIKDNTKWIFDGDSKYEEQIPGQFN